MGKLLARRYFYPGVHGWNRIVLVFPGSGRDLPATEALASRVLALPTGSAVKATDIGKICAIIRIAIEHGAEITKALAPA